MMFYLILIDGVAPKPPPTLPLVNYAVTVYDMAEMMKKASKCKATGLRSFDLKQMDEWDMLKLELLQIGEKYFGLPIDLDRFVITYTIPRKISDPIALINEDNYATIVKMIKPLKSPIVNIVFAEKICEISKVRRSLYVMIFPYFLQARRKNKQSDHDSDTDSSDSIDSGEDAKKKKKTKGKGKNENKPKVHSV